ncbi:gastrula zinc finger protein XlCGF57.1-like isoform X2 [Boleophthalmus pectinirostris]|uniref:gastrula zinc finger protein XlCGF57.1-like isoform X2 n=1 Tax=Boleophthalmus pectinirostris TaxID=150288 RepID=UPI00242A883B|nr:gastrula zinc finger protein XlCGF57.1-like isoform X2 [Boleophthalmus pectinirostris]
METQVKLEEETELWEPRGPAEERRGLRGPAEEQRRGPAEERRGPGADRTRWEPLGLKEEPESSVKQEPQDFPFHMVTVKTEEEEDDEDKSSALHQTASEEPREEPNGECGADSEEQTDSSEDTDRSEDYSPDQAPASRRFTQTPRHTSGAPRSGAPRSGAPRSGAPRSGAPRPGAGKTSVPQTERPHKCSVCERRFKEKPALTRHERHRHHVCPLCPKRYTNKTKLTAHLSHHVDEGAADRSILEEDGLRPYGCSQCGKAFARKAHLGRHMIVHRAETRYKCSVCERDFKLMTRLREHMRTHTGEKPFVCPVCGKCFAQISTLSRHQKHIHHMCPVCKGIFSDMTELNQHLKSHLDDGTLDQSLLERKTIKLCRCSLCGKECKNKSNLQRHMFVHTGEKPFSCSVCDEGFLCKFEVNQHLRFVHHVCPVCKEEFESDAHLTAHLRSHVEDGSLDPELIERVNRKPYSCSMCGKEFNCKTAFRRHILVHSGERPFSCPVCEKTFTQKGTLKTHQKIHSGDRPFVCSVCEKSFVTNSHLKTHLRSHAESAAAVFTDQP